MRRSAAYYQRPGQSASVGYARRATYKCVCGYQDSMPKRFREHQDRCSAVRIAKAADAKEGASS